MDVTRGNTVNNSLIMCPSTLYGNTSIVLSSSVGYNSTLKKITIKVLTAMETSYIIHKFNHDHSISQFLKVKLIKHVEKTEYQKFEKHGKIIRDGSEGNGYHGRCSNCGLALVTDLGYSSWDSVCEIEEEIKTQVEKKFSWTNNLESASKLNADEANDYKNDLILKQGWGEFNFIIK